MSEHNFNQVPTKGQSHSPSETSLEQPATTPFEVGDISGGEYQQFASETGESKRMRGQNA